MYVNEGTTAPTFRRGFWAASHYFVDRGRLYRAGSQVLRDRDLVPAKKKKGPRRFVPAFLAGLATALVLSLILRSFLLVSVRIKDQEMAPLLPADTSRVVLMGPLMRNVRAGDLVLMEHPRAPRYRMIRRVAAVGGDRVRAGERLLVNDIEMPAARVPLPLHANHEIKLGPDQLFVVAEQAHLGALDSRTFGPIKRQHLLGKVWQ